MLKTEVARSSKQRRTLKQILEDLKELGFEEVLRQGRSFRENLEGGPIRPGHPARKSPTMRLL